MNRTLEDLAAAFGEYHLTTPAGRLFRPAAPIDLAHALGGRVATRLVRERLHSIIDLTVSTPHLAAGVAIGLLPIGDRAGFLCVRTADALPLVIAYVDYRLGLIDDVYLVLGDFAREGTSATVKFQVNRMVSWSWIGGLVLTLGTVLAIFPEPARRAGGTGAIRFR